MSRKEYMEELKQKLRRLPKEDFQAAMEYYEEYFNEAGEEFEQQAMEDLGTPKEAADFIIRDMAVRNAQEPTGNVRQGLSRVWVGILAVCAAPMAIPLAFGAALVVLAFVFSVGIIFACVPFCGIAGGATAIAAIAISVVLMFTSVGSGILNLGLGLIGLALSLWLTWAGVKLMAWFLRGVVRLTGCIAGRGVKKHEE